MLRAAALGLALFFGAVAGVPLTPEEIELAMSFENRPKVEYVIENEDATGGSGIAPA
jgi:hypothetical protein